MWGHGQDQGVGRRDQDQGVGGVASQVKEEQGLEKHLVWNNEGFQGAFKLPVCGGTPAGHRD